MSILKYFAQKYYLEEVIQINITLAFKFLLKL